MADRMERCAGLLGRAAMDVWGDMPRDIQEALFETAMKGQGRRTGGIGPPPARPSPSNLASTEARS